MGTAHIAYDSKGSTVIDYKKVAQQNNIEPSTTQNTGPKTTQKQNLNQHKRQKTTMSIITDMVSIYLEHTPKYRPP